MTISTTVNTSLGFLASLPCVTLIASADHARFRLTLDAEMETLFNFVTEEGSRTDAKSFDWV